MLEILVVDDDACLCELLSKVLGTAGHRVTCASGGEEALAAAALHTFDVALCDLRMPRVDGLTVLRQLRALDPGTAVVLMTAHADVRDAIAALRQGAFDLLLKPMPMPELFDCLERAARERGGGPAQEPKGPPEEQLPAGFLIVRA